MSIWETEEEKIARYEADEDFPGYNMSEGQVERFWEIAAEHLEAQSAHALKAQLERILEYHGKSADDAWFNIMGSWDVSMTISDYEEVDECGWKSVERDWKDHLVDDLLYLNRNCAGELEKIWMEETRWGFWDYLESRGGSEEAVNAIVEFLSGYSTLEQWVDAC